MKFRNRLKRWKRKLFPIKTDEETLKRRRPDPKIELKPELEALVLKERVKSEEMGNTYRAVINLLAEEAPKLLEKPDKKVLADIASNVYSKKIDDNRLRGYFIDSRDLKAFLFWVQNARDRSIFKYQERF